jgi:ABC-type sugar transport system substrate-binding protein
MTDMRRGVWRKVGFAAVLAIGLTACGGNDADTETDTGTQKDGGGTIGVAMPTIQGPFFTAMLYGIEDEAKKLGYKVIIRDAGGYGNVDQQGTDIENLVAQQVDAILIDPADPTALAGAIQTAKDEGIPLLGSGDPAPGGVASVSSGHCTIGKEMAKGAKQLLPEGGDIGILAGPAGAFWSTERLKCFKEDIEGSDIEIVAEQASDPDAAVGLKIASDILQRYPEIDLLYGADDTVGVGASRAVQAANRCGQTKVLTSVLGEQAAALMEEGCMDYIVAQQVVEIGRTAVRTADQFVQGDPPAETEIEIPLIGVTKDNLAQVDIAKIRQPEGYKP